MHVSLARVALAAGLGLAAPAWAQTPVESPAQTPAEATTSPATPAAPLPVGEAGAEQIRQGLKLGLARSLRNTGELSVEIAGPIDVQPAGDHYNAMVPSVTVSRDGQTVLTLDPIPATLRPRDDGRYDVTLEVPLRYSFQAPDQPGPTVVTLGSQSLEGVFAPEYGQFLDAEIHLADVAVQAPGDAGSMTIDAVDFVSTSEETSRGIFDSTTEGTVRGWSMTVPAAEGSGPDSIEIGTVGFSGDMTGLRLADYLAFMERFNAVAGQFGQPEAPPQDAVDELQALLLGEGPTLFDSVDFTVSLADFRVDGQDTDVGLGGAEWSFSLEGLEGEEFTTDLGFALEGLTIAPPPPFGDLIPAETRLRLALADLPDAALNRAMLSFFEAAPAMGERMGAMTAAIELQDAILNSAGTLQIEEVHLASDLYRVDMDGVVRPSAASPYGFTAEAHMVIGGFEDVIARVGEAPEGQQAVQVLTLLQTLGAQSTDDAGEPVRTYDFTVSEDGKFLLNGTDLGPLLNQFMQ